MNEKKQGITLEQLRSHPANRPLIRESIEQANNSITARLDNALSRTESILAQVNNLTESCIGTSEDNKKDCCDNRCLANKVANLSDNLMEIENKLSLLVQEFCKD